MKTLVFAEKPSVGRDIARLLGASNRHEGYLEGPAHIVTWGIGHLVALAEPAIQNPSWKTWSFQTLPMLPAAWKYTVLPQTAPQFEVVRKLMGRSDIGEVVNAADAGREGELIFRLVYREAACEKPVKRLWISSMTDEAIRAGFGTLKPGTAYDPLASAAEARSQSDWLVGMNCTRGYTKKFDVMLTVGRVQTPTLAMIVRRHLEILDFKPVDFWEIQLDLGDFKAVWFDPEEKETPTRILDRAKAEALAASFSGKTAKVAKVTTAKKKQPPPLLYDLTTLQREANSRFGYTAAETLKIAQGLYETRKVITYPRTDSRHLSDDMHATLPARLKALPGEFEPWRGPLLGGKLPKPKRVFDNAKVSDHHAIIPTEQRVQDTSGWRQEERRIYDLVARRFLAALMPDQEYLATNVLLTVDEESFKANGRVVTAVGWRAIYERVQVADDDEAVEPPLPPLKNGDTRVVQQAELLTKQTKPPAPFTEATLLQAMETAGRLVEDEEKRLAMKDSGLGTPATRAEIIEKLIRVGYIVREKKRLTPTPKGVQLIRLVDSRLASPELTGDWERRLARISRGEEAAPGFMTDISELVKQIVARIKTDRFESVRRDELGPAGLKGGNAPARSPATKTPSGVANGPATNAPGRTSTNPATGAGSRISSGSGSKPPTGSTASAPTVPTGVAPAPGAAATTTSTFGAAARPTFGVCPACGKGQIIEGQRGFGCNRFREGCSYVVWKEFAGKKLTQTAIDLLIKGSPTRLLKGFRTEDGRTVSGRIRMKPDRTGIELEEEKES